MKDTVRIGCFAAFWGDTREALPQIIEGAEVDYLVADYLSEITMALLARGRAKDPAAGFVPDFIATLVPVLPEIARRGIKVVTNAGALNPRACADALRTASRNAGLRLRVATVEGDDLMSHRAAVLADAATDFITGQAIPKDVASLNAYLGARPIATALAAGADVVVTGRCVDAAVALGPLMHEFGWRDDDYDLLSAGALVGHIVECGSQCTGGNVTDWAAVSGWENIGYPVAECFADGTAVITKPRGTGGLVSAATVAEQVLYEIGDPGAYVLPDVVCDWREVRLAEVGVDRVRVDGARGLEPTSSYKVTATHLAGYRVLATAMFAGVDAAGKARRMAEALIARTERRIALDRLTPLGESSIEVVGSGDIMGRPSDEAATEAVVKVGVRSTERAGPDIFSAEFASMALVAQGMTGAFAGRPRVAPAFAVYHLLVDKASVPVRIHVGDDEIPVRVRVVGASVRATAELGNVPDPSPVGEAVTVPLIALARARSGDKGNLANIGVIARRPDFTPVLYAQLTTQRVAQLFAHVISGAVHRWSLPGLHAMNFVLDDVLGGTGGTSTLRYDPQGKSYAAMLLTALVSVPAEWVRTGLVDVPGESAA